MPGIRLRAAAALASLAGSCVLAMPAAPAHAATGYTVAVTFSNVKWGFIDDSGAYYSDAMSHVAQMYGRYGARATGSAEQWKLIGTWGAVGTSKWPNTPAWNNWNCSDGYEENNPLCMWNVGDAAHWPNGNTPTNYPTYMKSLPAVNGVYDFGAFPTCTSVTQPNDTLPYCKDSTGQLVDSGHYKTNTNTVYLTVQPGQTISLDLALKDYDYTSGDDLICGNEAGPSFSAAFDAQTLINLDRTVTLAGGSSDGDCQVQAHLQTIPMVIWP